MTATAELRRRLRIAMVLAAGGFFMALICAVNAWAAYGATGQLLVINFILGASASIVCGFSVAEARIVAARIAQEKLDELFGVAWEKAKADLARVYRECSRN